MVSTISTLEVRQNLGDLLNRVALRHDRFVIERKGKPLAAMVPVELMDQMQKAARLHLLDVIKGRESPLSQIQADQLANQAKHAGRKTARKKKTP